MDKETLSEICEMQKRYAELYSTTGLNGISEDYIHITEEVFFGLFHGEEITEMKRICKEIPWKYTATHDGVTVICISEKRYDLTKAE
jgi:propanediol utilization protein